jgi:DNA-binding Lrp family transcriptional regulator
MALKPQDVYVLLKIVAGGSPRAPYSKLALELAMSPSEVHASVKRAQASHLLHGPELRNRPNFGNLEEFLIHGLKYTFPTERGELTRGVPTSYAAEPLRHLIAAGSEPVPVWSYKEGKQRGIAFAPLYNVIAGIKQAHPQIWWRIMAHDCWDCRGDDRMEGLAAVATGRLSCHTFDA